MIRKSVIQFGNMGMWKRGNLVPFQISTFPNSQIFRIPFAFHPMASDPNEPPRVPVPDYRPIERFWPYVDLPEQPTDEELAKLDPELSEALFGTPKLPF